MTAPEWKPCPFCGEEPEIIENSGGFRISCSHHACFMDGGGSSTYGKRDNALAEWNRRAEAPALSGNERESIEYLLKFHQECGDGTGIPHENIIEGLLARTDPNR